MAIKGLLFCLFLYVGLVWVGAAYYFSGADIRRYGLLGTAIGFMVVLALVIGARVAGWWRVWRAKSRLKPAPTPKAATAEDPEGEGLSSLIAEASAALAKSPSFAGARSHNHLMSLPLYLLIGPEGSGKTSTFLNSGLEPLLLAGQVSGIKAVVPTRLCNLWLAKGALFAEIGGRLFSGEAARWNQLVRLLRGNTVVPKWRRWLYFLNGSEPQRDFRGAVAFCDCKELTGAPSDPQRLERFSAEWQDRLRSIGQVFGTKFPVYVVVTRCDQIPFFSDYFRRLPEEEAGQILGCTLPLRDNDSLPAGEIFAEAEAKRLTASFRPLYRALADRRPTQLAHEPDPAQRPGIYEFPRELKRIRSPLVQFLTDVFRPHSLAPAPVLRGYYLTGVLPGEAAISDPGATRLYANPAPMEATKLFREDASVFPADDMTKRPFAPRSFGLRWVFAADLFHKVVIADRPLVTNTPADGRFQRHRRLAFGLVCGLCAAACLAFFTSWARNRGLLSDIEAASAGTNIGQGNIVTANELKALDEIQTQIVRLRNGLGLSFHWGLYSGDRILDAVRTNYFRRFHRLLLIDLNGAMTSDLLALPADPDRNAPYEPVYRILKGHILVTSENCRPDSALLSGVLKEYRRRIATNVQTDWQATADRQIDFYAGELQYGAPVRLPQDSTARERARQYLRNVKGLDRFYAGILLNAERSGLKTARLSDLTPDYAQVLKGPDSVRSAFSQEGWSFLEKASKAGLTAAEGEACVLGETSGIVEGWKQSDETARAIQGMYIRDYAEQWKKFIEGYSVVPYTSAADAARKLEILAGHRSPLLALLNLTANQTYFPAATPQADSTIGGVIGKITAPLRKAESKVKTGVVNPVEAPDRLSVPGDISGVFQPVHWVEPPGSPTWIVDKSNGAYVEALASLGRSLRAIAESDKDSAIHQAAAQAYDRAFDAVRQIARGFKPVGVAGLDYSVQRLLEDPIRKTGNFIIRDMEKAGAARINSELRAFCANVQPVLRKFPFQRSSPEDTLLEELTRIFGPGQGIWRFQQQSLAEFVVKEGPQWKSKDPAKKPQATPEMLAFLNRAQQILDIFYSGGAAQPQITYALLPRLDQNFADLALSLEIDAQPYQWSGAFRKVFTWPGPPGVRDPGAVALLVRSGEKKSGPDFGMAFASRPGIWGIFRILNDAEEREFGSKLVEWKYSSGGVGRREAIRPGPVHLEIVTFPGGVDVFHPGFWTGLRCPAAAVR